MVGMSDDVPIIDLTAWGTDDEQARLEVATAVDDALQRSGFMLVTGHGVAPEAAARTRRLARQFFALPHRTKSAHAVSPLGGRGWLGPDAEANANSEGGQGPPDLKESLTYGAERPTGIAEVDRAWFRPNPWPTEVAGLAEALTGHIVVMHDLADRLMSICAVALGRDADFFCAATDHPTYTFNVNWYPPLTHVGGAAPGQFRIGPHTDFGTVTILDREPGAGGLQVFTRDGEWVDAPFHPEALTVNVGDLLARWSGDRWRSARHRVLPPPASAPEEDLVSLVFFYETNHDALIESMPAPTGVRQYPPVTAGDYLTEKYTAISVG
jgi:isopenicillin N synthase-like dioxygenase